MSGIDWSKAPEGYPVWIQDLHPGNAFDGSGWHKDEGNKYIDEDGEYWSKPQEGHYSVHHRPEDQPWTGDGLPPVGTVCEFVRRDDCQKESLEDGAIVTVIAHYKRLCGVGIAAFTFDAHGGRDVESADAECFRPIRTPEQIAAEEREAAIGDIELLIMHGDTDEEIARILYGAGYRKQPDNG